MINYDNKIPCYLSRNFPKTGRARVYVYMYIGVVLTKRHKALRAWAMRKFELLLPLTFSEYPQFSMYMAINFMFLWEHWKLYLRILFNKNKTEN